MIFLKDFMRFKRECGGRAPLWSYPIPSQLWFEYIIVDHSNGSIVIFYSQGCPGHSGTAEMRET